jgi:hypothetical protein
MNANNQLVCPYLENKLSDAKCYLTQAKNHDKQKSKSASDAVNALEGLGWAKKDGSRTSLTKEGVEFASTFYDSNNWLNLVRNALLGYGPFVGMLFKIYAAKKENPIIVKKGSISLGFPKTDEILQVDGKTVILSAGATDDTITRTRNVLFSWAVTGGFAHPNTISMPTDNNKWHIQTLEYVKGKKWSSQLYTFYIPADLFNGRHYVAKPLHYEWLTKDARALRERNQEIERRVAISYEHIINNRRFAIIYLLGKCALHSKSLSFTKMITKLLEHSDYFVINKKDFSRVMDRELEIAIIAGIPFSSAKGNLKPLTRINLEVASMTAPKEVVSILDEIYNKVTIEDRYDR